MHSTMSRSTSDTMNSLNSGSSSSLDIDFEKIVTRNNTRQCMASQGYKMFSKPLASTLQGSVWRGINKNPDTIGAFNPHIVIKVANKVLDSLKITILNGQKVPVQEDIISEMNILKYLTHHGMHFGLNQFMVNYIDFFHDDSNYYLVMENGGISLFDFVVQSHKHISARKMNPLEWQNICKNIFKQMVTFIHILHNTMAICHLDISLDNVLISDVFMTPDPSHSGMIHLAPAFRIKFCDFGLSQIFDYKANPQFLCNKWVGKIGYQAPEIYKKKANFNARAADIWSLGVCLFALLIGNMPYRVPSMRDPFFQWMMTGPRDILEIIKKCGKLSCITNSFHALDILLNIFTNENQRISAQKLLTHPWLKCESI
eukprot:189719_1